MGRFRGPTEDSEVRIDAWGNANVVHSAGGSTADTGRKRKAEDDVSSDSTTKMQRDNDGNAVATGTSSTTLARSAAATSSEGGTGTGETPVNLNVPRELGVFTETRTCYLPIKFNVSFNRLDNTPSGNVLKIRMNAPYNILRDTTFVAQTEGGALAKGVGVHQASPVDNSTFLDPGTFASFETTLVPAVASTASVSGSGVVADSNCVPAWRKWYERLYDSYHTIESHAKITFFNPETSIGRRANVFIEKDVYTASSTGNIIPTDRTRYFYTTQFKDIDQVIVAERNNNEARDAWRKTYTASWKPGTWSRNTLNAEDIKAWYPTTVEPSPNWVENLVIMVTSDEMNDQNIGNLNAVVELVYVVQFKDLKGAIRYPATSGADISTINIPSDLLQIPTTGYPWGSNV
jgi:hypothetical protein